MDLVVGATGILGAEIAQRLAAEGRPLAALVRPTSDATKLERLRTAGVTLVHGDLKERSTLGVCCRGISTVISTASSTFSRQPGDSIETVDHQGQLSLIEAARAAGVRHFIFVSFPPAAAFASEVTRAWRAKWAPTASWAVKRKCPASPVPGRT